MTQGSEVECCCRRLLSTTPPLLPPLTMGLLAAARLRLSRGAAAAAARAAAPLAMRLLLPGRLRLSSVGAADGCCCWFSDAVAERLRVASAGPAVGPAALLAALAPPSVEGGAPSCATPLVSCAAAGPAAGGWRFRWSSWYSAARIWRRRLSLSARKRSLLACMRCCWLLICDSRAAKREVCSRDVSRHAVSAVRSLPRSCTCRCKRDALAAEPSLWPIAGTEQHDAVIVGWGACGA